MGTLALSRKQVLLAELLAIAFVSLTAFASHFTGISLLLFPELAAFSHAVLTEPRGHWASHPVQMVVAPTLTGAAGLLISRHSHGGAIPVLLATILCLVILRLLKASLGPAASAAILPLTLGERHWMYPVAIFLSLAALAGLLLVWRQWSLPSQKGQAPRHSITDDLESRPHDRFWVVHVTVFLFLVALAGEWTGVRFLLFPPLAVMAYEALAHPELPGWVKRPVLFPIPCFLTAAAGMIALRYVGNNALSVGLTLAVSMVVLRLFQVKMPPALAVCLLPFVVPTSDRWLPVAVAGGAAALSAWFMARERLLYGTPSALMEEAGS